MSDLVLKTDLVEAMARAAGISEKTAEVACDALLDKIVGSIKQGQQIQLTNFGIFERVDRPIRPGRNPITGEAIEIPADTTMRFRVSKKLRKTL